VAHRIWCGRAELRGVICEPAHKASRDFLLQRFIRNLKSGAIGSGNTMVSPTLELDGLLLLPLPFHFAPKLTCEERAANEDSFVRSSLFRRAVF
jgi:hypothetical protein